MRTTASQRTKRPSSPSGMRLRKEVAREKPLQVVGVINAYAAILAQSAGFRALYLSGAGVANASYGIPDVGITTLQDVLIDVRRITERVSTPLLVDADTGWDDPGETAHEMVKSGAAGMHLEDQVEAKRCGHLTGKQLVTTAEMVERIRAAVRGRTDPSFVIMARTDAASTEGLEAAIERARAYRDAGADMIFAEALTELAQYSKFVKSVKVPVLANVTEFGRTPLFHTRQLASAGVAIALYPLSAFRAMNAAALKTFLTIRQRGTQKRLLPSMQTRAALYQFLGYEGKVSSTKAPRTKSRANSKH